MPEELDYVKEFNKKINDITENVVSLLNDYDAMGRGLDAAEKLAFIVGPSLTEKLMDWAESLHIAVKESEND